MLSVPELFMDGECVIKQPEKAVNTNSNNDGGAVINTQAIKVKYSQMRQQLVSKLRKQLVNTVNLNLTTDPTMAPPSQEQAKLWDN